MIAWRGASRYLDEKFRPAFEMEIAAMKSVKYDFGLNNLQLMIPFCRTPEEGEMVKDLLDQNDIGPASDTDLFVMVELPSNAIEADRFMDMMDLAGGRSVPTISCRRCTPSQGTTSRAIKTRWTLVRPPSRR